MPDIPASRFSLRLNAKVGPIQLDLKLKLNADWTVIFGPSGSGKTTVLRAVCGLLNHAKKTCSCEDVEFDGSHTSMTTQERRIAYAPQGAVLFPHLTVRDNVAFASRVRSQVSNALIDEALTLFSLHPLALRMPRDLSGGERQRVNLARAFAMPQPRLMLLDEPFTGIGRAQREIFLPRMREAIATRCMPVLSVTHDVEEVFLLNAEVVRIDAGRVIAEGRADIVLAEEREEMLRALRSEASGTS